VSPYCSLPRQIDQWFRTFHKAKEMCGAPGAHKRIPSKAEIQYLDTLVRGVYARDDLPEGILWRTMTCILLFATERATVVQGTDERRAPAEGREKGCAIRSMTLRAPIRRSLRCAKQSIPRIDAEGGKVT